LVSHCSTTFLFCFAFETKTRSIAAAESPRNASCPSVVSFNSTTTRAQSFIINYFGLRLRTINYVMFSSAYPSTDNKKLSYRRDHATLRVIDISLSHSWSLKLVLFEIQIQNTNKIYIAPGILKRIGAQTHGVTRR